MKLISRTLAVVLVVALAALGASASSPASASSGAASNVPCTRTADRGTWLHPCRNRDFVYSMQLAVVYAGNHPATVNRIQAGEVLASLYGPAMYTGNNKALTEPLRQLILSAQTGTQYPSGVPLTPRAYACIANDANLYAQQVVNVSTALAEINLAFSATKGLTKTLGTVAQPLTIWAKDVFTLGSKASAAAGSNTLTAAANDIVAHSLSICRDGPPSSQW